MAGVDFMRPFHVLEALARAGGDLGFGELAELTALPHATLHRVIERLVEGGYILRDQPRQRLQIGAGALEFANTIVANVPFASILRPILLEIVSRTGETVALNRYLADRGQAVIMAIQESDRELQYACAVGDIKHLHTGASGKAILAFLDPQRRVDVLARWGLPRATERTITDPAVLERDLQTIRRDGFAVSFGEWLPGAVGIAAPVWSSHDKVFGSLVITVPEQALKRSRIAALIDQVRLGAAKFSQCLGSTRAATNPFKIAAE